MIATIAVLALATASCSDSGRPEPAGPSDSVQSHPNLSGSWIRLRNVKNFIDNTLPMMVNGKQVGPLFSERIVVTQDADSLRVHSAASNAPPAKEYRLGDSRPQDGTGERVFWEVDTTTHANTLVSLVESRAINPAGTAQSTLRMWLDGNGWLIVQSSLSVRRKDELPSTSSGQVMSTTTYVRESLFKNVSGVTLAFDIAGDSDACGLSKETVSAEVTRAISGRIAVIGGRTSADTPAIRVAVRAVNSAVPQTPATAVVISVVLCDSTISVDVADRKAPPTILYRDSRTFSGSPPDTARWVLQQIKTDLDELLNVVQLANGSRRL